jgi:uncharacterized protein YcbK (DUF882 family)
MVRVKKNVVFKAIRREVIELLDALDQISNGMDKDIWITSANDGVHRKNSYHYKNLALDIRIWNLTKIEIEQSMIDLVNYLGSYYDIVLEKDHIHIEFDERRYLRDKEGGNGTNKI